LLEAGYPRKCVGEALARSEIQMHLMLIARDIRLRNDEPDTPKAVAGVNLLSRQDFFMTPEIRAS
jgi:cytochrome P450